MKVWVSALVVSLAVLAAGCATGTSMSPPAEQLRIMVAFYPLQFIAERVAGDQARIDTLTTPGAEAHDQELNPQQVAELSKAQLAIYQSGFQPAVDAAVEQAAPVNTIDTAQIAPPEGEDPHWWLDPANMAKITTAVAATLGEIDPPNAATYTQRGSELAAQLSGLDSEFARGLETCERREFVVSHEAFGYLARKYRLTQLGIAGQDLDSEPVPRRIAEIHTLVERYAITTIFYETLTSPQLAQTIARDLNLTTDVLDPIEGISPLSRGKDYLSIMNANLAALRTANDCT